MRHHRAAAVVLAWLALASPLAAAEPLNELLWPEGAPRATGTEEKDKPRVIVHLADTAKANGASVVICPGGGYAALAMGHEGTEIAEWLNELGVAGIVLDYRHRGKGYGHPAPMLDAKRALRLVRARSKQWKLDPERIGIMGFSAGGHLASTALTHFDAGKAEDKDPIERMSSRPDFGILCYPVIAMGKEHTHQGSQKNLLGENPSAELVKSLSNDLQVTDKTPPTFLWHTHADRAVLPRNSVEFYLALADKQVPAELHVYQQGRHGLGLARTIPGTKKWPAHCAEWLQGHGFLNKR